MTSSIHSLTYQIAEEYLVLHPGSASQLCSSLAKYAPFLRPHLPLGQKPLLEVWDETPCPEREGDELLEEVLDQGFHSSVYKQAGGGYRLNIVHRGLAVSALASEDWSQLRLSSSLSDDASSAITDRLIMIAFSVASSMVGCLKVHASVIEQAGGALVFMGVSGTGKSTHSRLWLQHIANCSLLNDDEPIVRLSPSGSVRVYGCPWSGSTPCYRDISAEVKAFVILRQAPTNALSKLSGRNSFSTLYSSCASLSCIPRSMARTLEAIIDILGVAPVYQLDNRPEYAAVQLTHSLLSSTHDTPL